MIEKKLSDYIDINPATKLEKGKCYPFVEMENIVVGIKRPRTENVLIFAGQSCSKFKPNDTLMARITPCLENGKVAKYSNGNAGFGSTEFIVFRGKSGLANDDYVYYLAKSQYIRDMAINSMTGASGRQRADAKFIGKIKWNFPSPNIQTKIAAILSVYDDLIENNNKRIKILEQMAENLYKEWFVRFRFPGYETAEFENGIPKGWEVVRVKNCLKRLPFNRLYKQDELESSGKVIVIDQSSNEFMGYHNNEPSHYASFEDPIILFGDHSCKFVLMTKNFSLGENVVPFKSIGTEEFDNYYLYYAVHKLIVTEEYKRHWGRFTAMKIFKPQINLQKKFAEFVKQLIHKKEMLWIQNQNLIKQRDLLLPRLMSGKLEV
ncbi:MAG: restriction endonuclease subunit S [Eubacteriales bacterium]|nr:restriction endonuclease subunit S [Eubacteriales bacterium]